jgi:hypothetical protein
MFEKKFDGKPYEGKLHVRFDEGFRRKRLILLYRSLFFAHIFGKIG